MVFILLFKETDKWSREAHGGEEGPLSPSFFHASYSMQRERGRERERKTEKGERAGGGERTEREIKKLSLKSQYSLTLMLFTHGGEHQCVQRYASVLTMCMAVGVCLASHSKRKDMLITDGKHKPRYHGNWQYGWLKPESD